MAGLAEKFSKASVGRCSNDSALRDLYILVTLGLATKDGQTYLPSPALTAAISGGQL